jgi:hypothetical protein
MLQKPDQFVGILLDQGKPRRGKPFPAPMGAGRQGFFKDFGMLRRGNQRGAESAAQCSAAQQA